MTTLEGAAAAALTLTEQEMAKYTAIWNVPRYSDHSPGERQLADAMKWMAPVPGSSITDWGCGTGRASEKMAHLGYRMRLVDIARNCYPGTLPFVQACLWELPTELPATDYAYCCDVLEHIPPEKVEAVIEAVASRTRLAAYLQIALFDDNFGKRIGQHLHLSVFAPAWWKARIEPLFASVEYKLTGSQHLLAVARH